MSEWELSDAERDGIFRSGIQPLHFPELTEPKAAPTLIVLTGHAGSGRSHASHDLLSEHGPDLAFVSGDDLRAFHPAFSAAPRTAGSRDELARATAGWVRDCIRFARENRRSLVLEGSFQDPRVVLGTAASFAAEGFSTRVVVAASRRSESLLSVASLYLRDLQSGADARFVSRDAHDRGFEASRLLVAELEREASVDRLTVLRRGGEMAFDASRADVGDAFHGASAAFNAAETGRLSRMDATQWLSELHHVTEFAASRRDLPAGMMDLLIELHEVALREVIPELQVPANGKFTIAIEQKTTARLMELKRALPRERTVNAAAPVIAPVGPERGGISR